MRKPIITSFLLFSLLLCFFIVDCSTSTSMTRFKSADYKGEKDSLVEINLFGTKIISDNIPQHDGLLKLSDRGQAEFIKAIDKHYSENNNFLSSLKNLVTNGDPVTDYANVDLKMIFTISRNEKYDTIGLRNGTFPLADRIENVKFSLQLRPCSHLKFTKWNKFSTEYDTFDIANVTFSKSFEQGGTVGGGIGGITGEVSGKSKTSTEEKQNIRRRYIQLNGSISDSKLEIKEEGVRDIDLAGNIVADVSIKFDKTIIRVVNIPDSISKDTTIIHPDKYNLNFTTVNVPYFYGEFPDIIRADLSMKYLYRHIVSGFKTYYEYDDKVNYFSGTDSDSVILLRKEDYMPPFFYICSDTTKLIISVKDKAIKQNYILFFREFWKARDFLKWVTNIPDTAVKKDSIIISKKYLVMIGTDNSDWKVLPLKDLKTTGFSVVEMSQLPKLE